MTKTTNPLGNSIFSAVSVGAGFLTTTSTTKTTTTQLPRRLLLRQTSSTATAMPQIRENSSKLPEIRINNSNNNRRAFSTSLSTLSSGSLKQHSGPEVNYVPPNESLFELTSAKKGNKAGKSTC